MNDRRVVDLAARLGQRLALLGRHDRGEIVAMREDQIEPAAQHLRADFCRSGAPAGKGGVRGFDRAFDIDGGAARRVTGDFRIGRVVNGEARTVDGIRQAPPTSTCCLNNKLSGGFTLKCHFTDCCYRENRLTSPLAIKQRQLFRQIRWFANKTT